MSLTATRLFTADTAAAGFAAGGAEVAAYEPGRGVLLVLGAGGVSVLDGATGARVGHIPASAVGVPVGGANSVAVSGDTVAVAFDGPEGVANGLVALFSLNADGSAATLSRVVAGTPGGSDFSVPDQLAFTPDGATLLVALEAEPRDDYAVDGEGGIGVIDIATGALRVAGFGAFDGQRDALLAAGVRLNLPGATVSQDLEPEYVTVAPGGTTAYATLQENNAVAELDIATATVTRILPLGFKDHSLPGQGLDPSDRDGPGNTNASAIREGLPVRGLFMPDGIASFEADGKTYLVTANEGDGRDYDAFGDEARVNSLALDPTAFPDAAALQRNADLGRLTVSTTDGDSDGDGDYEALYAFGARSFSIWEVAAEGLVLTFDSGDLLDRTIAERFPALVPADRDDNKGSEPESVVLGEVGGDLYAFVALERANATMAFRVESPTEAAFAGLFATEGDAAPEVIAFAPSAGPGGGPVLYAPNEVSGTATAYAIQRTPDVSDTFTLQILHAADFEAGVAAVERAPNLAAIVDALEDTRANSITLLSGDNFIPGPFTAAGTDPAVRDAFRAFYETLLGAAPGSLAALNNSAPNAVDIAIANAVGAQASAIGNHEFDLGPVAFAGAFDTTASNIGAQFPYLSANLDFSGEPALAGLFTAELRDAASYATTAADFLNGSALSRREVAPWATIEENGETIGVLGATTQILESISSTGGVEVIGPDANDMAALAAILQPYVDGMTAQGIDKIVLLSHLQQIALERELATLLEGVDVIIGGGSNTIFADATDRLSEGDVAGGGYPEFYTGADGRPVALVNTDGNYDYVGRLVVTFDADGVILPASVDPAVSGAFVTDEAGVDAVAGDGDGTLSEAERAAIFAPGTRGGLVQGLTDAVGAVIDAKDGVVFGFTDVFLEGRRAEVRTGETNLGNLTADANLFVARAAVEGPVLASIKNGGGIRAEIGTIVGQPIPQELPPPANPGAGKPEGGVSQLDIENSLRFNNALSVVTMTAAEFERVLEHGVAGVRPGATPGAFPQVGGLRFAYDADFASQVLGSDGSVVTEGLRVREAVFVDDDGVVLDILVRGGALVGDADRAISFVTLSFLASGGDGYPIAFYADDRVDLLDPLVTERTGEATFAADGTEQDALAEYLAARFATPETAFGEADTDAADDLRIQNLDLREASGFPAAPIEGTAGNDRLVGTDADDVILGLAGRDTLIGAGGNDRLAGGAGDDALIGNRGADTLDGGAGVDRMRGSGGDDVFLFRAGDLQAAGSARLDAVLDFEGAGRDGGDLLRFEGFGAGATLAFARDASGDPGAGGFAQQIYTVTDDGGAAFELLVVSYTGARLTAADYLFA